MTQNTLSVSEDWQVVGEGEAKPACLVVQRRKEVFVLPWFRFAYAEGDNTAIEIAFATHVVNVAGYELAGLLAAVAFQKVIRLVEPSDQEARYGARGPLATKQTGPGIQSITVTRLEK